MSIQFLSHAVQPPRAAALPGVMAAQFHSFAQRMPSYYASIIIMMVATMVVYRPLAPGWLACGVPLCFCLLSTWRAVWWTHHRNDPVTDEEAQAILRRSVTVLVVSAIIALAVDVRLFQYGGLYARVFLLLQILSSACCGFYCLMHLRRAALLVFAAVMLPFVVLTTRLGNSSTTIAACTCMLTAGVMILAMLGFERDFFALIQAKAEASELSRENLRLAQLDMLTGLPNRRYFFDQMESRDGGTTGTFMLPTIGIIDLDGFKPVNDTFGHRAGDRVLQVIARRLNDLCDDMHHLSRLGGDEFVFATTHTHEQELHALGRAICVAVSESIPLDGRSVCVGCSVGFAVGDRNVATVDGISLFEQADYALYHAKRNGRARTVLFSEEHEQLIRESGAVEQAMRSACIESEFYLEYQPIIDLRTRGVAAFECLARWQSPVLGSVSPSVFIPIAEQSGLISGLTRVLLRKALAMAHTLPAEIHISFNVSPHELSKREHTEGILQLIQESGVAADRVAVELTETALMNSFKEVREHIDLIRGTGASVYLDDFGTGYSSLSYIHALPLDRIKVDRSFVQSLGSNPASLGIIRSVISLCRDLQIPCVVEGVETAAELDQLCSLDAEFIQGYYFSRPLAAADVPAYVTATETACALQTMA